MESNPNTKYITEWDRPDRDGVGDGSEGWYEGTREGAIM